MFRSRATAVLMAVMALSPAVFVTVAAPGVSAQSETPLSESGWVSQTKHQLRARGRARARHRLWILPGGQGHLRSSVWTTGKLATYQLH